MADRSWMPYIVPFGIHQNDTLAMVRINDSKYIRWMAEQTPQEHSKEFIEKCQACVKYMDEVDPWSSKK